VFHFRGGIDDFEWRFLLTGGVALENPFPNPAPAWLADKSWSEMVRVTDLPAFKGFMDHFKEQVHDYVDIGQRIELLGICNICLK